MARRELVRRLNLEVAEAERPDYDTEMVDGLVDWICETETLDEQRQRITEVLERLRLGGTDD